MVDEGEENYADLEDINIILEKNYLVNWRLMMGRVCIYEFILLLLYDSWSLRNYLTLFRRLLSAPVFAYAFSQQKQYLLVRYLLSLDSFFCVWYLVVCYLVFSDIRNVMSSCELTELWFVIANLWIVKRLMNKCVIYDAMFAPIIVIIVNIACINFLDFIF